jgi:hypothetical protein
MAPSREKIVLAVRIIAFALHALMAVVTVSLMFACRVQVYTNHGYHTIALDWQEWKNRTRSGACNSSQQCARHGVPWAEDEPLPQHGWNPYAMVATFEFISASFALYYLRETEGAPEALRLFCKRFPIAWNVIGAVIYYSWYGSRGASNCCEPLAVTAAYLAACAVLAAHDGWRERFEHECLSGVAAMFARRFYQCYVHGIPWRIPLRASPGEEPLLPPQEGLAEVSAALRGRLAVLLRYAEYTITASFLYVGVLSIFVVGPPSWAFIAGFTGIFVCNASGLALHVLHTEIALGPVVSNTIIEGGERGEAADQGARPAQRYYESSLLRVPVVASIARPPRRVVSMSALGANPSDAIVQPPRAPPPTWRHATAAVFGAGTWHEHWVCKLELLKAAWFGLATGIFIVIYFARGYMFNSVIPAFVLVVLWNLLIQYSLFGIVGTVFYAYDRLWPWFEPALDVLSLAAKVPVAVSVAIAFLQMPGGAC